MGDPHGAQAVLAVGGGSSMFTAAEAGGTVEQLTGVLKGIWDDFLMGFSKLTWGFDGI